MGAEKEMKTLKTTIILIFVLITFIACASKPSADGLLTLDQAIAQAANRIDERIEAGSKIALINFTSPSDQFSFYVLDELTANLVDSGKLIVVDRREIDLIRSEFNFQLSGDVSDESMQSLGRMLGAQSIVSGSLSEIGKSYRIVIRVLAVETAAVAAQYRTDIVNDRRVRALLAGGRTTSVSGETAAATSNRRATQTTAAPVYQIGDTGPAGGIIFYDKGNTSGGWRYLEAAPADIDRRLRLLTEGIQRLASTELLGREVGRGKSNTEEIMREAANRGGGFGWAAQAASVYSLNGFNDWFLPSWDELNFM